MARATVGIVGLGLVGQAISTRLRSGGWPTHGFDLRPEARAQFAAAGGTVASDLRELGRAAQTVVLAVFESRDVVQVLEGNDDLLGPESVARCVIDCSTGDPDMLVPLAGRLAARGISFIEAPLSGSSEQIAAGEATFLLGGEAQAIAACSELLAAIATQQVHVGAAGMGARAKLATNLVLGLNRAVLAEGMAFAQSQGIAPGRFLALVLATPARSAAAEIKGPLMVRGDFAPQSRIRQHLKDVELMLASGGTSGMALPFSETHARLLRQAVADGDGDLDNSAIIRRYLPAGSGKKGI